MPGWEYMNSTWWSGMMLSILATASLVLFLVVSIMLLRCFTTRKCNFSSPETPIDILKKRYARGEITAEEYQHMKDFLEG